MGNDPDKLDIWSSYLRVLDPYMARDTVLITFVLEASD